MTDITVGSIGENFRRVQDRIIDAAVQAGRKPEAVRLVVVSKTRGVDIIQTAIEAGARLFGENYADEAVEKIRAIGSISGLEWHMIGHIQSRKARLVAEHFHFVHSLDSVKLAMRLNNYCQELNRRLPVLLEFNLGSEASKSGWRADEREYWPQLLEEIEPITRLQNLEIRGLMTMPPLFDDPEQARPYFKALRNLGDYLQTQLPQLSLTEYSMGTSSDFEVAVAEGATLVRVGTAILGPRDYTKTE